MRSGKRKSGSAQRKRAKGAPTARQDGLATRQLLLEAAGQVFAEQGYARATSKEICKRAAANVAAVNYHFGDKDGLYATVLQEAHSRLVSLEMVAATAHSQADPRTKLKLLLTRIFGELAQRKSAAWELRVLSRELLAPTPMMEALVSGQIAPKAKFLRAIIADLMQLPAEHPAVSRSTLNLVSPIMFMVITGPELQRKVAPNLQPDPEALVEHMLAYALGGMQAVARAAR